MHFKHKTFWFLKCSDKIHQGGGVAAPVGGQIFREILPYLDIEKDGEDEESIVETIEVPNIVGLSVTEANKKLKELELKININNEPEEYDKDNAIVKNQTPNVGIKVNKNSNIFLDIWELEKNSVVDVKKLFLKKCNYYIKSEQNVTFHQV